MNYPRVNLLKKSEQRYQGAVSRKFIFISAVVAPILLIALLSGVKLIQYTGVMSELSASRKLWDSLEPRLTLYKDENRGLSMNRTALDLIDGWQNSHASLVDLLEDIQGTVPEQIQFTRLTVRSGAQAPVYTKSSNMQLDYNLVIEGRSQGALAENHVIGLRKDLLNGPQIGNIFDSINLASMRKRQGSEGVNMREFRLEGKTMSGDQ